MMKRHFVQNVGQAFHRTHTHNGYCILIVVLICPDTLLNNVRCIRNSLNCLHATAVVQQSSCQNILIVVVNCKLSPMASVSVGVLDSRCGQSGPSALVTVQPTDLLTFRRTKRSGCLIVGAGRYIVAIA